MSAVPPLTRIDTATARQLSSVLTHLQSLSLRQRVEQIEAIERAIWRAQTLGKKPLIAGFAMLYASTCAEGPHHERAILAAEQATEIWLELGNRENAARSLIQSAVAYSWADQHIGAYRTAEYAFETLGQGDPALRCEILLVWAAAAYMIDRYDEVLAKASEALEVAQATGNEGLIPRCMNAIAHGRFVQGEASEASRMIDDGIAVSLRCPTRPHLARLYHTRAEMLESLGQQEEAEKDYRLAARTSDEIGDPYAKASALLRAASIAMNRSDDLSVIADLHLVVDMATGMKSTRLQVRAMEALSTYYSRRHRFDLAYSYQQEAQQVRRQARSPVLGEPKASTDRDDVGTLRWSESFLQSLSSTLPGVIFQWTERESGECGFTYVSERTLDILGERPSNLIRDWRRIALVPADRERFRRSIGESALCGTPWSFTGQVVLPSGMARWVGATGTSSRSPDGSMSVTGFFRDVTNEHELERSMRRNQRKFRAAVESHFNSFFLLEPVREQNEIVDYVVVEVNRRALETLGRTREEVVGRRASVLTHPNEWPSIYELIRSVHKTGEPFLGERAMDFIEGSHLWVELQVVPLDDGLAVFMRDVTERHDLQDALRRSDERSALAIAGSNDGVWDIDLASGKNYFSPRWLEMLGYDVADLEAVQTPHLSLVHPDDVARFRGELERHIEGIQPICAVEIRLRTKSGGDLWVLSRSRAVVDDAGNPVRLVGTITDISERRRTNKLLTAVAESNGLLIGDKPVAEVASQVCRVLGEASGTTRVCVMRFHDGDDGRRVMSMFAEWTAPGTQSWIGDRRTNNIPADAGGFLGVLRAFERGESAFIPAHTIPIEERGALSLMGVESLLSTPIFVGNELWGIVDYHDNRRGREWTEAERHLIGSVATNLGLALQHEEHRETIVTTNENLERALARARELAFEAAAASRAKGEFVANMSHEIRTPMNGVIGLTELLLASELSPQQREYAVGIHRSGQALLAIINDVLDFSKMEAGKLTLDAVPFDLRELAREVASLFVVEASKKGVQILTKFSSFPAQGVLGDPVRVRQVLTNLISNAVKFTSNGEVEVSLETTVQSDEIYRARFQVRDSGIGIPSDRLGAIFESFTQGDNSTTRVYGGTGLGLTITRRLVWMMGGRIDVQSEVGKGSVFLIELPFPRAELPKPARASEALNATHLRKRSPRVLVAEDNKVNILLAQRLLEKLGCEVDVALDGRQAVEKTIQGKFDLVFMDIQMPVMDGLSATRRIREQESRHTPIIAMTASALEDDRLACLQAGMDDHLSKPFSAKGVMTMLERWLPSTDPAP